MSRRRGIAMAAAPRRAVAYNGPGIICVCAELESTCDLADVTSASCRMSARFVRRATVHVSNKPHDRIISTAAPERRSHDANTRLAGMGVFGNMSAFRSIFGLTGDEGKGARVSLGRAPIAP